MPPSNRLSKFLSLVLRHEPEKCGLTLAPGGWVAVDALIKGAAQAGVPFTRQELEELVRTSDKQRFAFDETGERIRANQGHSVEVDLELVPTSPPAVLYHGTPEKFLPAILQAGLLKMQRHHVHLSPDVETARKVGARRGKAAVLVVDAAGLAAAGAVFFCSQNGVWLVDHVPATYLKRLE